jgi:hypothetical protein
MNTLHKIRDLADSSYYMAVQLYPQSMKPQIYQVEKFGIPLQTTRKPQDKQRQQAIQEISPFTTTNRMNSLTAFT